MKKPSDIKKIKYIPLKNKTKQQTTNKSQANKQTREYVNKNQRKKSVCKLSEF